jgi:hypothetical protein
LAGPPLLALLIEHLDKSLSVKRYVKRSDSLLQLEQTRGLFCAVMRERGGGLPSRCLAVVA